MEKRVRKMKYDIKNNKKTGDTRNYLTKCTLCTVWPKDVHLSTNSFKNCYSTSLKDKKEK